LGERAAYRRLDVREEDDWEGAIAFVEDRFGQLDVLVNNAGVTGFEEDLGPQDPEHATLEGWRAVHATNLDGVYLERVSKPPSGCLSKGERRVETHQFIAHCRTLCTHVSPVLLGFETRS
jgi:hypothetical protein